MEKDEFVKFLGNKGINSKLEDGVVMILYDGGTPEECRAAMEKQIVEKELESHDEKYILKYCISLMQELVGKFEEWYEYVHGEDAIKNCVKMKSFVTECHISISFKNCFF